MSNRLSRVLVLIIALMVSALTFPGYRAQAASLVEVTNFGTNPSSLRMYLYVPNSVKPNPAILVAVHYCTGSGPAFFSGTEFASLADQYGFIIIYPSATRSGSCFDVSSPQALTHNGGSDPVGIMSMVTYVEQHNNGDPSRVYVTGASSGGMMTNVLLGDYPDVFKAGAAFMGVPFACFATTDGSSWNSTCSSGNLIKTPQQWGDLVRAAYPGYSGPRPRMQVWHGTNDTTLAYPNFGEEIKQWTNVLGVSQTPSFTDTPRSGWTRTRYGGTGIGAPVEGISIQGVGHDLPLAGQAAMAIQFFGLDNTSVATPTRTFTSSVPTNTPVSPTRTNTPSVPTNTSSAPTNTPVPTTGGLQTSIRANGAETNQQTPFAFAVKNTSTSAKSGISVRIYFTTDNGNAASNYTLEKYYDQSGVATLAAPTLASGSTYYFTVNYGTASLAAGAQWEFQTALHLASWGTNFDGTNDHFHTGYAFNALPAAYTVTNYIPAYVSGTLTWGVEPGGIVSTPLPTTAATATRTNTPIPTTGSTAIPTTVPTTVSTSVPTSTSVSSSNLVQNGEFDNATTSWVFNPNNGGAGSMAVVTGAGLSGTNALAITITNGGTANWHVQVGQSGLNIVSGRTYIVSFVAKAASNRTINVFLQQNASPFTVYSQQNFNVTTTASTYSFTWTSNVNDANTALRFNVGNSTVTTYIDNVSVR